MLCAVPVLCAAAPAPSLKAEIIVLDTSGKEFKPPKNPVHAYWDIDNDGLAEKCTWVGPHESILAIDRDGDGVITDATEIFGGVDGNAFGYLQMVDINNDMTIGRMDQAIFAKLRIWTDADGNGRSSKDELRSLPDAIITDIRLDARKAQEKLSKRGITAISTYAGLTGKRAYWRLSGARAIECDDADTVPLPARTVDAAQLARLPDMPPMGRVPALRDAIMKDRAGTASLLSQVEILVRGAPEEILGESGLEQRVESLLLRWARVDHMSRWQNGMHIDARRLAFLAAVQDKPYDAKVRPGFWQAYDKEVLFGRYYDGLFVPLLLQTPAVKIFAGTPSYDPGTGRISGVTGINPEILRRVTERIGKAGTQEERKALWRGVARLVDYAIGFRELTVRDGRMLDAAIRSTGFTDGLMAVIHDTTTILPDEIPASRRQPAMARSQELLDEGIDTVYKAVRELYGAQEEEIIINDVTGFIMVNCCRRMMNAEKFMRMTGFTVTDITQSALAPGQPAARFDYDHVLYGEKKYGDDNYGVTAYYAAGELKWAMGRIWRAR
jgi:hypothetical protein